jgi:hypothetical protein
MFISIISSGMVSLLTNQTDVATYEIQGTTRDDAGR